MTPSPERLRPGLRSTLLLAGAILAITTHPAAARSFQPPTGHTGAPAANSCMRCHSGGAAAGNASLDFGGGISSYAPGQVYPLDIVITDPTARRFGFAMVARDSANQNVGTFTATGANTGTQGSEVNHRSAPTFATAPGSHTFSVEWTAPAAAAGDITFYLATNAANNNRSTSGDSIYLVSLAVGESTPGNQPPALTVPQQAATATAATPTPIPGLAVGDPDAGNSALTLTLGVDTGTLELDTTVPGGLTPGDVTGNGSSDLTVNAAADAINTTLASPAGLRYTSNPGHTGQDTLALTLNDNGNTGAGGPMSTDAELTIDVTFLGFGQWGATAFPPQTPADQTLPGADPDADGRTNAYEFFAGTDPLSPEPDGTTVELDATTLSVVVPRASSVDPSIAQPEWTSDLVTWSTGDITVTPDGDTGLRLSVPRSVATGPGLLLRLTITPPAD